MEAGTRDGAETTQTREVLDRYRLGAAEAADRLFATHHEKLLKRARGHPWMRGLKAHTTSEDVVAEVFARALAGGFFERFADRGRGSLEHALTKILERTLADGYRRLGTRSRGFFQELRVGEGETRSRHTPSCFPAVDATPTSSARAEELLALCRKTLDAEEWEVWQAVELLGLDSLAIAARIGKSASAARSILHRARMKLLRALAEAQD